MSSHNTLGHIGEDFACSFLVRQDYHILARNWTCHPYEIEIIADDWGELVFVEVKTRTSDEWSDPAAAVDRHKREHLSLAARAYMRQQEVGDVPFRFDIIALVGSAPPFEIVHYKNAFPLELPQRFHPKNPADELFF